MIISKLKLLSILICHRKNAMFIIVIFFLYNSEYVTVTRYYCIIFMFIFKKIFNFYNHNFSLIQKVLPYPINIKIIYLINSSLLFFIINVPFFIFHKNTQQTDLSKILQLNSALIFFLIIGFFTSIYFYYKKI